METFFHNLMILKVARILPYKLIDNFKGGKDRPEKVYSQIWEKIHFSHGLHRLYPDLDISHQKWLRRIRVHLCNPWLKSQKHQVSLLPACAFSLLTRCFWEFFPPFEGFISLLEVTVLFLQILVSPFLALLLFPKYCAVVYRIYDHQIAVSKFFTLLICTCFALFYPPEFKE